MKQQSGSATARQRDVLAISANEIRLQLERILISRSFVRSERLIRFLRFTVEQTLEGRADQLKEYLLGVEVFDRKSSYDPRVDPIVRVEARRLRSKVKTYYETEGRNDEIGIEYPTGSYTPRFHRRQPSVAVTSRTVAVMAASEKAKSVVVLPFTNLSASHEDEYFSDGLTEELIHELTKVDGLRVVAWQSASQLKGKPCDFRDLGEQLNVATALGGSVRRSGDRLRVTSQLVNVDDGRYLWSETYERRMKDVFAIQDEISRAIVDTLRIKLVDRTRVVKRSEYNLAAYNLYLKGRFHWNRRTPEGLNRSIRYYEEALSVDGEFALGYAGVADSYSLLADYGLQHPAEIMPRAKAAAEKAIEIDPTLAEAHTSLGFIKALYDWDWPEAGFHYRKSIELNPGYATAHHWYACDYLASLGHIEEALEEMKVAILLDPLSPIMNESAGYILMLARRYDEAIAQYRRVLELDAHYHRVHAAMGRAYCAKGLYNEAIAMLSKGRSLCGALPNILGALGQTYGLAGKRDEARAVLDDLSRLSAQQYAGSTCFALIHLGLGEKEKALDWLELGCDRRELPLTWLKVHPGYDDLRREDRFTALLRRIGLAD